MKVGIPREIHEDEMRVAVIPLDVKTLTRKNYEVIVEKGAGVNASFPDEKTMMILGDAKQMVTEIVRTLKE